MKNIFICSPSSEHMTTRNLHYFLEQKGVNVWSSIVDDIKPGENYTEEIIAKIKNSRGSILLVSQELLESEFITKTELPTIFSLKNVNNEYFIIPVLLEQDIDFSNYEDISLKNIQYANSSTNSLKNTNAATHDVIFDNIYSQITGYDPKLNQETKDKIEKIDEIIRKNKNTIDSLLLPKSDKDSFAKKLPNLDDINNNYEILMETIEHRYRVFVDLVNYFENKMTEQNEIMKKKFKDQEFKNEEVRQGRTKPLSANQILGEDWKTRRNNLRLLNSFDRITPMMEEITQDINKALELIKIGSSNTVLLKDSKATLEEYLASIKEYTKYLEVQKKVVIKPIDELCFGRMIFRTIQTTHGLKTKECSYCEHRHIDISYHEWELIQQNVGRRKK